MTGGKPDEIDLRILAALQKDGRMDGQALAREVNLSRTPVSARVDKLLEAGVIRRFTALVDREKVGRPVLVVTHVKLQQQTAEQLAEFEKRMRAVPEVQTCLLVSGEWNFILLVTAVTPQDYYRFLMERVSGMANVEHTDSCFVLAETKSCAALPLQTF